MHVKFSSENMKRINHLEDVRVNEMVIFEWILQKEGGKL